jgi:putative FmdB family regulatory protein
MPTYEYVCDACKHEFEKFQSILAAPEKVCPKCRKRKVRRKIGIGAGVLFKGTGFYETDYRSDGYSKAAEADRKSSESPKPADAKSDAKPAASTGGTTETKSAPTESAKPAKEPRVKAIHPSREGRGQGNLRRPAAKKSPSRRRGSVLKRVLIAVAALVVALVVGGMLMIDVIARKGIEVAGTAVLGVDTSVRSVRIGLISDTSSIKDLTVANPKGYTDPHFMDLGNASLTARLGELMGDNIQVRNITIQDLTLTLENDASGKLNANRISDNLPSTSEQKEPSKSGKPAGASRTIVINEFRIERVKVRLRNLVGGKQGVVEAALPDIVLKDVKSDGSVDVLASQLSGVVIASVLQATVSANIEGLSSELIGDLKGSIKNSVDALPDNLRGPVESIRGGLGTVLDKTGEGVKEGIGGAIDSLFGDKKKNGK